MEVQAATPPRISSGTNFAQSVPAFQLMFTVVMIILANALAFLTQILPSGQVFFDNDPFERRQPVIVIALAGVVFAARFGFLENRTEVIRPFFSCQCASLGEFDNHCKCLSLPWFGENRTVVVARQQRQVGEFI